VKKALSMRSLPSPSLLEGLDMIREKNYFFNGKLLIFKSRRRLAMPTYDFTCEKCNKAFTLTLKLAEYEKKKYQCPKCNSKKVKQNISAFQTITSKKS
jgi:putative FmdB family regulatory protein